MAIQQNDRCVREKHHSKNNRGPGGNGIPNDLVKTKEPKRQKRNTEKAPTGKREMRIHEPKVQTVDIRFYGAAVGHVQDRETMRGVVEYRRVMAQILERRRCLMELGVMRAL